nr:hypothetical protein [uncultured Flavobacterium sp.]
MKRILIILMVTLSLTSSCQTIKNIEYKTLEKELVTFLIKNGDVHNLELKEYENGNRGISIKGFFNNYQKGELINGIYIFYQNRTHARNYYVIIEGEKYTILNISSRDGLDKSIKDVLDYSDRNKLCADITEEYVTRLVAMYYRKNKNPQAGIDVNCESGVKDTIGLP